MMMKRMLVATVVLAGLVPMVAFAAASVDYAASRMSVDNTTLRADGIDNAQISVTLTDTNLGEVVGKKVILSSSRGSADEIKAVSDTTDLFGKARFQVDSLRDGIATFTAMVDGQTLQKTVTVTYSGGLVANVQAGDLIKIPDDGNASTLSDTAVYYYAVDGRRYVFPNEKVFYTWFPDFSKVKVLVIDQMSLIPIGGNVTYKPGSRLVKFQTDPKTYLVTKGGVLRWAMTEDVAKGWFGSNWNQHVDDITEAFYVNYKFGQPVANALDLPIDIAQNVSSIDADKGLVGIFP